MNSKRAKYAAPVEELGGPEAAANLQQLRVLVVGAGGLGCEILKNLACSGFEQIEVIDMDRIELTNLNRQFLFRLGDIGAPKAEVAVRRIMEYLPGKTGIKGHFASIESMPDRFYESFHMIVCGLDSVRARRWINSKIVDLCYGATSPSGLRPLIDGGTEGLQGQCRVILPGITPCYECTLSLHSSTRTYPLCTIASIPRLPEHCVEWARIIRWPQIYGENKVPDYDCSEDMEWLYKQALERAAEFNIDGVDLELVYGTLKRIIPAVASTNAIIAASCSLEALKLAAGFVSSEQTNYFMFSGHSGAHMTPLDLERQEDCSVCGTRIEVIEANEDTPLLGFLELAAKRLQCEGPALPSISSAEGKPIYMSSPMSLREALKPNLGMQLRELFKTKEEVAISHASLRAAVRVVIKF